MNVPSVTAGEQLAHFVSKRLLNGVRWDAVAEALVCTGRSEQLCIFFAEIATINLTCKIIVAGTSLLRATTDRPARSSLDGMFQSDFREFIRERLYVNPPMSDELFRYALRGVQSAGRDVSATERKEFKVWAKREHKNCYMCGRDLDFEEKDKDLKFTLEHIWPQCYGGDSVKDNWLPACATCNSQKKGAFATWAMAPIQSLVIGFDPSENDLTAVTGSHRFALQHLTAQRIASERQISLKKALMQVGTWAAPRLLDQSDVGDFFNLANHG